MHFIALFFVTQYSNGSSGIFSYLFSLHVAVGQRELPCIRGMLHIFWPTTVRNSDVCLLLVCGSNYNGFTLWASVFVRSASYLTSSRATFLPVKTTKA